MGLKESSIGRKIGRIAYRTGLVGTAAAIAMACSPDKGANTPAIATGQIDPIASGQMWDNLSPSGKLNALEIHDISKIKENDLNRRISLATAQLYCEKMKCKISPEQMAASVSYLSEDKLIKKLESKEGIEYSDIAKRSIKELSLTTRPSETTYSYPAGFWKPGERIAHITSGNDIYVNQTLLDKVVQELDEYSYQHGVVKGQRNYYQSDGNEPRNARVVIMESLLIREFTRTSVYSLQSNFDNLVGNPIISGEMRYFHISDEGRAGVSGDEAVIELAAQIIQRTKGVSLMGTLHRSKSGAKIWEDALYGNYSKTESRAHMIDGLNASGGVTDNEFLGYVSGQLPYKELIQRWGLRQGSPPHG